MGLFRRPAPTDPAEVERLRSELASLRAAFDDRIASLDDRVTSVSTELVNQLTELGHDLDAGRNGQIKLAGEQARYQIAFREDLARLAQDLQRTR